MRKIFRYALVGIFAKASISLLQADSPLENKIENEIQEIENIQYDTTIVKKKNYFEGSCKNYYQVH